MEKAEKRRLMPMAIARQALKSGINDYREFEKDFDARRKRFGLDEAMEAYGPVVFRKAYIRDVCRRTLDGIKGKKRWEAWMYLCDLVQEIEDELINGDSIKYMVDSLGNHRVTQRQEALQWLVRKGFCKGMLRQVRDLLEPESSEEPS